MWCSLCWGKTWRRRGASVLRVHRNELHCLDVMAVADALLSRDRRLLATLARLLGVAEAEAQFSEVIRLRPDFARAHLNHGVALAKQGKLDDALSQFKMAVQLDPADKVAQQNLDSLQANIRAQKMRTR